MTEQRREEAGAEGETDAQPGGAEPVIPLVHVVQRDAVASGPEPQPPSAGSAPVSSAATSAPPPPPSAPLPPAHQQGFFARARAYCLDYVLGSDPTFWSLLLPLLCISLILFTRSPATNYIFDEQEALLANPYVNATGGLRFIDAIHRDFWGLPADRSVGSYRPIPDFLWRALWGLSKKPDGLFRQPFIHHIYNVVFHAVNGAILGSITFAWTKRRGLAYIAGAVFVACAVLTEAVSGIVGIADVLGGMGALLAIAALSLPAWAMPFAVFMAILFGLFSKESAIVCVPLIPFAALLAAPLTHPDRPARFLRTLLALTATAAGFYLYVELRRRWFLSPLPADLQVPPSDDVPWFRKWAYEFLVWFHQAPLPKDPLNNPLAEADTQHRIAGALRVYWRGLTQIVFPKTLSGDYSFPQEPIPAKLIFPESIAGAAAMVAPLVLAVPLWFVAMVRERRGRRADPAPDATLAQGAEARKIERIAGLSMLLLALSAVALDLLVLRPGGKVIAWRGLPFSLAAAPIGILGLGLVVEGLGRLRRPDARRLGYSGAIMIAIGMVWTVVSYFPHSNIPVVLPTVRAERFWYFPAIGTTLVITVLFAWLDEIASPRRAPWLAPALFWAFLLFQGEQAYRHAMNYRSDLDFWEATKDAVPNSAKAHLNYSVMKGARKDLQTRLVESKKALELAPKWPMAHIYTGDTLCRLNRAGEAWPYYKSGFEIGPNELSLIALALQCMYDEKVLLEHEAELKEIAGKHEGTWIAYLAIDTLNNHEKNKGVDPKHRPRGYNEGPRE